MAPTLGVRLRAVCIRFGLDTCGGLGKSDATFDVVLAMDRKSLCFHRALTMQGGKEPVAGVVAGSHIHYQLEGSEPILRRYAVDAAEIPLDVLTGFRITQIPA